MPVVTSERVACPCCGYLTLTHRGGFEICPVCFWEDDGQDDVDAHVDHGGPNRGTLWQARTSFLKIGACEPIARDSVCPARHDETQQRCWTLLDDAAVELVPATDMSPWNLLHDGVATHLKAEGSRLSITVKCGYLRMRFAEPGTAFVIDVLECSALSYAPYEDNGVAEDDATSSPDAILAAEPNIVSAEREGDDVVVWGSGGILRLRYRSLALRFDTGTSLAVAALDECARQYWDEWERRVRRS
jgi:Cysteine-rich CPCC